MGGTIARDVVSGPVARDSFTRTELWTMGNYRRLYKRNSICQEKANIIGYTEIHWCGVPG